MIKEPKEQKLIFFENPAEWRNWLEENHTNEEGVWLKFYKKSSGVVSLNYKEALDEALCFGWIDGQSKSIDDDAYMQKFTPRRPRSIWSKINIENVARLEKEGKMTAAGLKQIEAAKADGRWDAAYDSPKNMVLPEDFLLELSKHKEALLFFETLNKTNKFAIAFRLQTAKKPETREKRMQTIIEMLKNREKIY